MHSWQWFYVSNITDKYKDWFHMRTEACSFGNVSFFLNTGENGKSPCKCCWYLADLIWIDIQSEPAWSRKPSVFIWSRTDEHANLSERQQYYTRYAARHKKARDWNRKAERKLVLSINENKIETQTVKEKSYYKNEPTAPFPVIFHLNLTTTLFTTFPAGPFRLSQPSPMPVSMYIPTVVWVHTTLRPCDTFFLCLYRSANNFPLAEGDWKGQIFYPDNGQCPEKVHTMNPEKVWSQSFVTSPGWTGAIARPQALHSYRRRWFRATALRQGQLLGRSLSYRTHGQVIWGFRREDGQTSIVNGSRSLVDTKKNTRTVKGHNFFLHDLPIIWNLR